MASTSGLGANVSQASASPAGDDLYTSLLEMNTHHVEFNNIFAEVSEDDDVKITIITELGDAAAKTITELGDAADDAADSGRTTFRIREASSQLRPRWYQKWFHPDSLTEDISPQESSYNPQEYQEND